MLVEAGCDIARELYLGIVIDRAVGLPVLMASSAGGMNIEEVAAKTPELIFKESFNPDAGLQPYQVRKLCAKLGLTGASVRSAEKFMRVAVPAVRRPRLQPGRDQPARRHEGGRAARARRQDQLRRQRPVPPPALAELRDRREEDPTSCAPAKAGLSYVQLDGNIGCLVNGAGLAMSTMDIIKLHGGEPANFLDVGGGANTEQVTEAFRILLSDKNVKAVLVNIFGGIMSCTTIATAIVEAYKQVGFNVPLVVRLEGTEVEEGRKILAESGVDIIAADGPHRRGEESRGGGEERVACQSRSHELLSTSVRKPAVGNLHVLRTRLMPRLYDRIRGKAIPVVGTCQDEIARCSAASCINRRRRCGRRSVVYETSSGRLSAIVRDLSAFSACVCSYLGVACRCLRRHDAADVRSCAGLGVIILNSVV